MHFTVFDQKGTENTVPTLELAKSNAEELNIKDIVIASTWGNTISEAIKIFDPAEYNLTCVIHNYGFNDQEDQEFPEDLRTELIQKGVKFVIGSLPFSGISSSLLKIYSHLDSIALFARLLRSTIGDGVKVAMEIVMMAVDAGAIKQKQEVLAIAGSSTGADTCCLIRSASSRFFQDLRVEAILAKPK
jgi:hypothetical protein